MKYLFLLIIVIFFPEHSEAQNLVGDLPIPGDTTIQKQLCEFRRLFCGNAAVAILGTVVFIIGMLSFTGKLTWTYVVLISAFAVVFISADKIREGITGPIRMKNTGGVEGDNTGWIAYRCDCETVLDAIGDIGSGG
jgi:type IV secretory pathway VirB2 component (pilin)